MLAMGQSENRDISDDNFLTVRVPGLVDEYLPTELFPASLIPPKA